MRSLTEKKKIKFDDDDTFDIQHIFMENFLQKTI